MSQSFEELCSFLPDLLCPASTSNTCGYFFFAWVQIACNVASLHAFYAHVMMQSLWPVLYRADLVSHLGGISVRLTWSGSMEYGLQKLCPPQFFCYPCRNLQFSALLKVKSHKFNLSVWEDPSQGWEPWRNKSRTATKAVLGTCRSTRYRMREAQTSLLPPTRLLTEYPLWTRTLFMQSFSFPSFISLNSLT